MSKEKQIEEMAEVLRHSCENECWKDGNGFAFNPKGNATRAECAQILYKFLTK